MSLVSKDCLNTLVSLVESKDACIGVVGLGYVGLPLALEYCKSGYKTIGIDLDARRIQQLRQGQSYIHDVQDADVRDAVRTGKFIPADGYSNLGHIDVWFVCVPTPVTDHKDPDTSFVEASAVAIAKQIRAGQIIILKSTTYPETTERLFMPIIDECAREQGIHVGQEWFLAYSPERVDPGNSRYSVRNTPAVVGGVTSSCGDLAKLILSKVTDNVLTVSSPKAAEMSKLLENIFRSVNIALVNELARLCDRMGGVSIWEVVEAAATKPFGFMPFYPGPGLGGHCIPIDPYYLSWLARRYDFETSFITLSARTNEEMPYYVVASVIRVLAERGVQMSSADVLVLGAAFKRDVADIRHSPALKIMTLLIDMGIKEVRYTDPFVGEVELESKAGPKYLKSSSVRPESIAKADLVILVTDHTGFPYQVIAESAKVIIDTRNAFQDLTQYRDKVFLLGGG